MHNADCERRMGERLSEGRRGRGGRATLPLKLPEAWDPERCKYQNAECKRPPQEDGHSSDFRLQIAEMQLLDGFVWRVQIADCRLQIVRGASPGTDCHQISECRLQRAPSRGGREREEFCGEIAECRMREGFAGEGAQENGQDF